MRRILLATAIILFFLVPDPARGQEISGPDVRLQNNEISVSFSLVLAPKQVREIREGIDKELKLYIDLFKVWDIWPDEFVLGKVFTRRLKADPIKKEFVATSSDGNVIIERRFRSFESMMAWTLSVKDLTLTNTRELEPGRYFVRITAESKIRKLPPVIGQFIIFLSENEFKVSKDSGLIAIPGTR
jgi:hypothetical protein